MTRWLVPILVALALPFTSGALKQRTVHKDFRPKAKASSKEVVKIADRERRRWGGPSIVGRMFCESRLHWAATNGQYRGLLQIGPIWGYLWSGTPRDVRYVTHFKKKREGEDVRVKVVHEGRLPRNPTPYHAHAAIRVGQRAVSGHRTTGWSCSL